MNTDRENKIRQRMAYMDGVVRCEDAVSTGALSRIGVKLDRQNVVQRYINWMSIAVETFHPRGSDCLPTIHVGRGRLKDDLFPNLLGITFEFPGVYSPTGCQGEPEDLQLPSPDDVLRI